MEFFSENKINQLCQSPFHHYYKSPKINQLIKKKVYLGLYFRRIQAMVCQPCCFYSYVKASHPGWFKRQRKKKKPYTCGQEAKEEGRRHQVPTMSYVPCNPKLPIQPHFLHAPPLSHSPTLVSKSLPHSPSGTSYSTSSLVRINLHMGFHSPCGELFQLLNIHLLQHNLNI